MSPRHGLTLVHRRPGIHQSTRAAVIAWRWIILGTALFWIALIRWLV